MADVLAPGAHHNVSSADLLSIHFNTVGGYTEDLKIGGWALMRRWAFALDNTVVHYV